MRKIIETAQRQTEARSDSLKILTIGTADSGGTMYPVGKAISLVIGDADSSIKINISASTGSSGNVHSLQDGSIDLGLVSGDIAFSAVNGTGEFKGSRIQRSESHCGSLSESFELDGAG